MTLVGRGGDARTPSGCRSWGLRRAAIAARCTCIRTGWQAPTEYALDRCTGPSSTACAQQAPQNTKHQCPARPFMLVTNQRHSGPGQTTHTPADRLVIGGALGTTGISRIWSFTLESCEYAEECCVAPEGKHDLRSSIRQIFQAGSKTPQQGLRRVILHSATGFRCWYIFRDMTRI